MNYPVSSCVKLVVVFWGDFFFVLQFCSLFAYKSGEKVKSYLSNLLSRERFFAFILIFVIIISLNFYCPVLKHCKISMLLL